LTNSPERTEVRCGLRWDRCQRSGIEALLTERLSAVEPSRNEILGALGNQGAESNSKRAGYRQPPSRVAQTPHARRKAEPRVTGTPREECLHHPLLSLEVPPPGPALSRDRCPQARRRTRRGNEDHRSELQVLSGPGRDLTHRPSGRRREGLGPVHARTNGGNAGLVLFELVRVQGAADRVVPMVASRGERTGCPVVHPRKNHEAKRSAHRGSPPGVPLTRVFREPASERSAYAETSLCQGNIRWTDAARGGEAVDDFLDHRVGESISRGRKVKTEVLGTPPVAEAVWLLELVRRRDPMIPRKHWARPTDPIPFDEGKCVRYADDTNLHPRGRQALHPRPRTNTTKVTVTAKGEEPSRSIGHTDVRADWSGLRRDDNRGRFKTEATQRVIAVPPEIGALEPAFHNIRDSRIRMGARLTRATQLVQEAINAALSGRPLKAARRTGGERSWITGSPGESSGPIGHVPTDPAQDRTRCGKLSLRHFSRRQARRADSPRTGPRECSGKAAEGEAVGRPQSAQAHEALEHILTDERRLRGGGTESARPDAVGQCLQLFGDELPPTSGESPANPRVKVPATLERVPASMDKTGPASCPNLLVRGHIASAVSVRRSFYRTG